MKESDLIHGHYYLIIFGDDNSIHIGEYIEKSGAPHGHLHFASIKIGQPGRDMRDSTIKGTLVFYPYEVKKCLGPKLRGREK